MLQEMFNMIPQEEANKVKEIVVCSLVAEGYLTKEQGDEVLARYAVVVRGRSWFGRMFDRLRGEVPEGVFQYAVAKVVWGPEKEG